MLLFRAVLRVPLLSGSVSRESGFMLYEFAVWLFGVGEIYWSGKNVISMFEISIEIAFVRIKCRKLIKISR